MKILYLFASFFVYSIAFDEFVRKNATFVALVPKVVRRNYKYSVAVKPVNIESSVEVTVKLYGVNPNFTLETIKTLDPGKYAVLSLGKVPAQISEPEELFFSLIGRYKNISSQNNSKLNDSTQNVFSVYIPEKLEKDLRFFMPRKKLIFESKSSSLLIETDRGIYKPGQTVKFRGVLLSSNLKPKNTSVEYKIVNSDGNIMMLKKGQIVDHGLISDEINIHPKTKEGIWKIFIKDEKSLEESTASIKVEKYKLPKFSVDIKGPNFISSDTHNVTFIIKSRYTFGKPTKGRLFCLVTYKIYWQTSTKKRFIVPNFDGTHEILMKKVDFEDLGVNFENIGTSLKKTSIECNVTDRNTNITMSETKDIVLTRYFYKVKQISSPDKFKPFNNYKAVVKVSDQDGNLMHKELRSKYKLKVEVRKSLGNEMGPYFGESSRNNVETKFYPITPNGIIEINFETSDEFYRYDITNSVVFDKKQTMKSYDQSWSVYKIKSTSSSFMNIHTLSDRVRTGEYVNFSITVAEPVQSVNVLVSSRGVINAAKTLTCDNATKNFEYELQVTENMQPSLVLLASYIKTDGEIIADSKEINVESSIEEKLNISMSSDVLDAGEYININMTSLAGDSLIGVKAIDVSSLLMGEQNDISYLKLSEDLKNYGHSNSNKDAFDKANIFCLTDGEKLEEIYPINYMMRPGSFVIATGGERIMLADAAPVSLSSRNQDVVQITKTRKKFPETWIWLTNQTNENGSFNIRTKVPDTITSWQLSAFSLSHQTGLGIAQKKKVKVFRSFFVNLDLPLNVIKDEVILVQAIVFNYFEDDLECNVHITETNNYKLMSRNEKKIVVKSKDSNLVSFPVRMTSIGNVDIKVAATSSLAYDSLIRTINVEPEGVKQCYSESIFLSHQEQKENQNYLGLNLPSKFVPGSVYASLNVFGDLMGGTINNLENLLKQPSGCGEQNMINFAPAIFTTLYLEQTKQLSASYKKKAYKFYNSGYQNQLNYKRNDGSFSAFGGRDKFGSLWLTAFVLKCFKQATKLESGMKEQLKVHIEDATRFINDSSNEDGSFKDLGKVIHRDMQSGANNDISLAAYVAIALAEVDHQKENSQLKINKLMKKVGLYLETKLNDVKLSPYKLSIVTYALHLLNSSKSEEAFDALLQFKVEDGNKVFWHESNMDKPSTYNNDLYFMNKLTNSKDIEITSYALLTYVYRKDVLSIIPVLKWLSSQQNSLGGYDNTQNTVLAIQSISEAAALLENDNKNLTITLKASNLSEKININEDNYKIYNQFKLEPEENLVEIISSGTGMAVVQLSVCFNTIQTPFEKSPFVCNNTIYSSKSDYFTKMSFCCSLIPGSEPTGMLLYKIKPPSGHSIDVEDNKKLNSAKIVEFDKGTANFYYDQLDTNAEICSSIQIVQTKKVAEIKPSTVEVLDYYRPRRSLMMKYSISQPKDTDFCSLCEPGECPECGKDVFTKNVTNFVEQTVHVTSRYEQSSSIATIDEDFTKNTVFVSSTYKSTVQPSNNAIKSGLIIGSIFLIVALLIFKLRK